MKPGLERMGTSAANEPRFVSRMNTLPPSMEAPRSFNRAPAGEAPPRGDADSGGAATAGSTESASATETSDQRGLMNGPPAAGATSAAAIRPGPTPSKLDPGRGALKGFPSNCRTAQDLPMTPRTRLSLAVRSDRAPGASQARRAEPG